MCDIAFSGWIKLYTHRIRYRVLSNHPPINYRAAGHLQSSDDFLSCLDAMVISSSTAYRPWLYCCATEWRGATENQVVDIREKNSALATAVVRFPNTLRLVLAFEVPAKRCQVCRGGFSRRCCWRTRCSKPIRWKKEVSVYIYIVRRQQRFDIFVQQYSCVMLTKHISRDIHIVWSDLQEVVLLWHLNK